MTIQITREIATKVRDTVDQGLIAGLGKPSPGNMCVEAAVCYALGLPHGDDPPCVLPVLRTLKIQLNDANWPSDSARAKGLRRLAIAQLGSENLDSVEFANRVAMLAVTKVTPRALRAAACACVEEYKDVLEKAAVVCEQVPDLDGGAAHAAADAVADAVAAARAAHAADCAHAATAARAGAATAAHAADCAHAATAARAGAATHAAARAAACAARAAAADCAAASAADCARAASRVARAAAPLNLFAEEVVQILIAMNAPGCAFLDLVP